MSYSWTSDGPVAAPPEQLSDYKIVEVVGGRPVGPLTKLDRVVRRSLLRWPSLFATRWDVLHHLYLTVGNGYEWRDGELLPVADESEPTEEECRGAFFRDLDEFGDDIARARRRFQLDHIELLVHERRKQRIGFEDVGTISLDSSAVFCVPDSVEASFQAGAVEVLRELIPGLYYLEQCGQDRGIRVAAEQVLGRLDPVVDFESVRIMVDD